MSTPTIKLDINRNVLTKTEMFVVQNTDDNIIQLYTEDSDVVSVKMNFKWPDGTVMKPIYLTPQYDDNDTKYWSVPLPVYYIGFNINFGPSAVAKLSFRLFKESAFQELLQWSTVEIPLTVVKSGSGVGYDSSYNGVDVENLQLAMGEYTSKILENKNTIDEHMLDTSYEVHDIGNRIAVAINDIVNQTDEFFATKVELGLVEEDLQLQLDDLDFVKDVVYNHETYVITFTLRDDTTYVIDLPVESLIMDIEYDDNTKSIIITLENGSQTTVPIGDLVAGLASESWVTSNYVAKEAGKGLSTNDYTAIDKSKVNLIETGGDTTKYLSQMGTYIDNPQGTVKSVSSILPNISGDVELTFEGALRVIPDEYTLDKNYWIANGNYFYQDVPLAYKEDDVYYISAADRASKNEFNVCDIYAEFVLGGVRYTAVKEPQEDITLSIVLIDNGDGPGVPDNGLYVNTVQGKHGQVTLVPEDILESGVNIKTINGQNILGSGNIVISGGAGGSSQDWNDIVNTPTTLSGYGLTGEVYTKTQTDNLLATKQDELVSGTDIKTLNGESLLGSGDLNILESSWLASDSKVLALSDRGKVIYGITGGAKTFTIPKDADVPFPMGAEIHFMRRYDDLIIAPDTGVVTHGPNDYPNPLKIINLYRFATIKKIDTDEWVILGAVTPHVI